MWFSPDTLTVFYDSVSFNQQRVHVISISDKLGNACLKQDSPTYSIQPPPFFIILSIILIRQRYVMGSCVLLAQTTTNLCRKKLNQG